MWSSVALLSSPSVSGDDDDVIFVFLSMVMNNNGLVIFTMSKGFQKSSNRGINCCCLSIESMVVGEEEEGEVSILRLKFLWYFEKKT